MEGLQKIITNILLVFALVSIGFAFGKNSVKQMVVEAQSDSNSAVVVYYLHSTFRCETCNKIEQMSGELVHRQYGDELKSGEIEWRVIDFQIQETIAQQFEVAASCVVVAQMDKGVVQNYSRLDEVWTLIDNPPVFDQYITKAIDGYRKAEV